MYRVKIYRYNPRYKNCLVQYISSDSNLFFNRFMAYSDVKQLKDILSNSTIELEQSKFMGNNANISHYNAWLGKRFLTKELCKSSEGFLAILRHGKFGKFGKDQEPQQINLF